MKIKLLENTSDYIKAYLDPYEKWSIAASPKQRIDLLRNADVNWTSISNHIRGMDYKDFLRTPYWKAIAAHAKYRAGYRCQLCNSCFELVTHHRDYGIHGREHAHIYDLVVLCKNCHEKFHSTQEKTTRTHKGLFNKELNHITDVKTTKVDDQKWNCGPILVYGLIALAVVYFWFHPF